MWNNIFTGPGGGRGERPTSRPRTPETGRSCDPIRVTRPSHAPGEWRVSIPPPERAHGRPYEYVIPYDGQESASDQQERGAAGPPRSCRALRTPRTRAGREQALPPPEPAERLRTINSEPHTRAARYIVHLSSSRYERARETHRDGHDLFKLMFCQIHRLFMRNLFNKSML